MSFDTSVSSLAQVNREMKSQIKTEAVKLQIEKQSGRLAGRLIKIETRLNEITWLVRLIIAAQIAGFFR